MGDASRPRTEQPDPDLAPTQGLTAPEGRAGEPAVIPIPAYGLPRPVRQRHRGWQRLVLAIPAYLAALWLVVLPGYPVPVLTKGVAGFLLAGFAAGLVARRRGWLAALLGCAVVLLLALVTLVITLNVSALGPAFLINSATANGKTATVGEVRGDLLQQLLVFAGGATLLSVLGGLAGSTLRRVTPATSNADQGPSPS